jgi:adenylylsulfate kinase-like enzyme
MRILICGLSGSGKTTLSKQLADKLCYMHLNADEIRTKYDDWDFSAVGRTRQAQRMAAEANQYNAVVIDMIAPLAIHKSIVKANKVIFMNTKKESIYKDTDNIFTIPSKVDLEITDFNYDINDVITKLSLL